MNVELKTLKPLHLSTFEPLNMNIERPTSNVERRSKD
jgi:hypothetical protein